ncbi:unnamed protein product [Eruca vesicaria subsp. sativa]|uniref:Uncharacterized protein n=1 Tax=Eruca vesicaria subsp. sativa TaxID=29727 RepID=A0ABC8K5T0_ERUVS|nr:unnamed protein product [Eruca vesicaria subsp. sativa]
MSDRLSRSSGYSKEEDQLLCQVYLEISQDPIKGDKEISGGSPSQRPIGVKKSKLKRKNDDQTSVVIKNLKIDTNKSWKN